MSCVVGIDLSSKAIDLVRLDENVPLAEHRRVSLFGTDAWSRTRSVSALMPPGSYWDDVYLCAIERPYGASRRGQAVLMRVQGAVLACIPHGLPVWEISPAEWRQAIGLKGNAPKSEVRKAVWRIAPTFTGLTEWDGPGQDALDAFATAYVAREKNARAIESQLVRAAL